MIWALLAGFFGCTGLFQKSIPPITCDPTFLSEHTENPSERSQRQIFGAVREHLGHTSLRPTEFPCEVSAAKTTILHQVMDYELDVRDQCLFSGDHIIVRDCVRHFTNSN